MVGAGCMTDPNVLGADSIPLKFLFDSGNTRMVHLYRAWETVGFKFPDTVESLVEASGLTGTKYVVPNNKKFFMLYFTYSGSSGAVDINLSIQRNATVDNTALGDNLYQIHIEANQDKGFTSEYVGGLQFNAGDYVTPYNLSGSGALQWSFSCWGIECDA